MSPSKGLWLLIELLNPGFLEYTSLAERAIGYSYSFIYSMFSTTSWMLLHPLLLIFSNSLGAASPTKNIVKRVDLPADISAWSAFGDSYASGIGAGTLVTAKDLIYSGSYPQQMNNNDPRIGNAASRKFQDLAHVGAGTREVIARAQSNDISASELVTVQIGT